MGINSNIEWTDHTFNPWIGCTKVSPECANCYAEALAERYGWAKWGKGQPRHRTSESYWRAPLKWNKAAMEAGERRRVFCASLADVFDSEVNADWRADLFELIERTPALDWLLLTKRPENMPTMLPLNWRDNPRPNVWLGTSVGHPDTKWRIGDLVNVPAAVHFLSCEPLLGDLGKLELADIEWVIVGGESGHGARPMHPDWARSLRDQCCCADVPFFFKQWGVWVETNSADDYTDGLTQTLLPDGRFGHYDATFMNRGAWMKWVGKKAAGRLLDDREWSGFPFYSSAT